MKSYSIHRHPQTVVVNVQGPGWSKGVDVLNGTDPEKAKAALIGFVPPEYQTTVEAAFAEAFGD